VQCPPIGQEDGDDKELILPFKRILPILFKIDSVGVMGGSGCIFLVSGSLKGGSDLPKGQHLETLVRYLIIIRLQPANTIILHKE
jgi:hypothetical protein